MWSLKMGQKQYEWHFDFGLSSSRAGRLVTEQDCDELMSLIVDWANSKSYGIGGGFRPYGPDAERSPEY